MGPIYFRKHCNKVFHHFHNGFHLCVPIIQFNQHRLKLIRWHIFNALLQPAVHNNFPTSDMTVSQVISHLFHFPLIHAIVFAICSGVRERF